MEYMEYFIVYKKPDTVKIV